MKATVISVFKSKKYIMHYWYHNAKKFNDDHESIEPGDTYIPMMEMHLWKDKLDSINDKWVRIDSVITFATPELVKQYTGEDLFYTQRFWHFEGRALDIEFEWEDMEYPYLKKYHSRDFVSTNKHKIVKITKIEDTLYDW